MREMFSFHCSLVALKEDKNLVPSFVTIAKLLFVLN